jgi:YebC/PmpR family DNA-binding regulatory protein
MSGHSKWAQIKHQKAATDKKRGAVFTKLGNNITVAAREGGSDLSANFKLRLAVDAAKAANVPKDNIERAIKRGTGELAGGELQVLMYEAVGPGGAAILIKALTDNKNRTAAAVKHLLSLHQTSLGNPGSVSWQFHEQGVIRLDKAGLEADVVALKAIDLGALDVREEDDNLMIVTDKNDLRAVSEGLEKAGLKIEYAEIDWLPQNYLELDVTKQDALNKLFEALDEEPEVSDYYTNIKY